MDKSAEEVKEHFTKNAFGIQSEGVDPTILEGMKQRDVAWELDAEPTDKEIDASIKQAKAGKSTVDGIYMDYYKAMEENGTGRAVFRDLLKGIWRGEEDGVRVTAKPLPALPRWDSLSAWEKVEIATEMGLRISFLKENPKRNTVKAVCVTPLTARHARCRKHWSGGRWGDRKGTWSTTRNTGS